MNKEFTNAGHSYTEAGHYEDEKPNIFKPILFNTEMVQAILAGRKTQTRRILKVKGCREFVPETHWTLEECKRWNAKPKYEIGDILWVRETSHLHQLWNKFIYKADNDSKFKLFVGWKPSLFMPKEAARVFLKVTNVRCERLNDISERDAVAEGIKQTWISDSPEENRYKNYFNDGHGSFLPERSFQSLWDSINAKKYPWVSNPWVWVYEFERIEKPADFNY